MKLTIRPAHENDIPRILELMTRTHQLNTSGLIFPKNYVTEIILNAAGKTKIIVAELKDKFGEYGIIGTSLSEESTTEWTLKYLAISCRVMGRGIERAFLYAMMKNAFTSGMRIGVAEFRETGKNKLMRTLFQMTGYELNRQTNNSDILIFNKSLNSLPELPKWIELV
jgi:FkbH-like protein